MRSSLGPVPVASSSVSVVVPCFAGLPLLVRCLSSLRLQTLPRRSVEVLLVVNGPDDGVTAAATDFRSRYPSVRLRVLRSEPAGASAARNVGLDAASSPLVTFVDHDDTVHEGFLAALLAAHEPGVVPVAHLVDVREADGVSGKGPLSRALLDAAGRTTTPGAVPRAASFTTGKLLDTDRARRVHFDEALRSGEDVDFFWRYFAPGDLLVRVLADTTVTYRRTVREVSVGRQPLSSAFNVDARLDVVRRMITAAPTQPGPDALRLFVALARGQAGHVGRWLEHRPADAPEVAGRVRELQEEAPAAVRAAVVAAFADLPLGAVEGSG